MPLTSGTTTTTMEGELGRSEFLANPSREPTANNDKDNFALPSSPNVTVSPPHEAIPTGRSTNAESRSNSDETLSHALGALSTRVLKQEYTLNNQLGRLRADDRKSLLHLPASQQRALLATHHKQMEKARRTEQIQRGNLECAGNHFSRLGTIRLIRKPPHTGNVHSLNR
ncbi:hypothetical protein PV11_05870 [Exophiala sideris]|uniref:Uncharacterized protein n=1 Tax=Exophiala sideris TaxID=1016849 RepID=A0A0D1ZAU9_9EURO|nr:hypothetical protein PV11_05870 [Exophiala sideris]